ncbi:MAG TPA: HDOD domain-containing protein [Humidesulfovibrio sp.]|uniref:EAL and HDOD domain-containing protein n=1 Tax=Humidesulfovibrio sp. TaxID=2910988 RepID=UPI002BD84732|nr:HDOD domain-containing protein [Humidesulfovibrio sp.]HWR04102.1 HDOD domain-containing protein [Humidesulfovibrio sp.]
MTNLPPPLSAEYSLGFYARQPVFDAKGAVWAHSIYFRDGIEAVSSEGRRSDATTSVLAALVGEGGGPRRIIKFSAQPLIYELPLLFPKETLVVEMTENLAGDMQAMEAIRKIKARGYLLAVSRFSGRPEAAPLHALADVLWVDALGCQEPELNRLAMACRAHPALPGLMRIETRAMHETARALGFQLFQGHYFQEPETIVTRKLSSSQFSRLKLLQAIEQEDPDFKSLAETIRADVALSFKLFGLLNSAFFSFPHPVESVKQALSLLGWEPLRTWIRLIILTDLTPPGKSSELPRAATLRGRFLELAGRSLGEGCHPRPENLFLVGMFSLLPALLDQPMSAILETLRLPEDVAAALTDQNHPAARWLLLAASFERADWAGVQATLVLLGLAPLAVAQAYSKALEWTDHLFRSVPA